MRTFRWLAAACAVAMLPAASAAQTPVRGFADSWFWGAKAGVASFSTSQVQNATAPLVGGEWLITRTRFGLYLAGDYSFFEETSTVPDGLGGQALVEIKDLRRFTVAGLFFPKAYATIRPYGGVGLSVNWIGEANAVGAVGNSMEDEIAERRDRASFVFLLGVQGQLGRLAPFGQVTMQPSHTGFLLDDRAVYLLEGGIRINVGPARER
jgi:outer membrane protein W